MTEIKKEDVEIKEDEEEMPAPGKTIHFQEMQESMEQAISNLNKIINEQGDLIDLVETSDKAEAFKDFIKESKKQLEYYSEQRATLMNHVELLTRVNEKINSNEEVKQVCDALIEILGLFK